MTNEKEDTQYIKVAKRVIELCKRSGLAAYTNQFSNHIYTTYQHITLLCLRQYERKGYERFIKDLPDKSLFIEFLKLNSLPHFTALQKFAERIKQTLLDLVLAMALARTGIKKIVGGVDGTGNKPNRASTYYVHRLECFQRKNKKAKRGRPKKRRAVRRFIKTFPFVELRTQIPIAVGFSRRNGNESPYFKPVARKAMKCGKPFKYIPLHKGYDAEYVHEFIHDEMHAESIIPARNKEVPVWRTKGKYRKQMKRGYSKKKYHQRSKNETVNYVVDALMGEEVYALDWRMQNKELLFRYLMYAAYRFDKIKSFFCLFFRIFEEIFQKKQLFTDIHFYVAKGFYGADHVLLYSSSNRTISFSSKSPYEISRIWRTSSRLMIRCFASFGIVNSSPSLTAMSFSPRIICPVPFITLQNSSLLW